MYKILLKVKNTLYILLYYAIIYYIILHKSFSYNLFGTKKYRLCFINLMEFLITMFYNQDVGVIPDIHLLSFKGD